MKKFDKIYLDMDGVIADFDGLFIERMGESCIGYEDKYGTEVFWDKILEHRDFFLEIKPFPYMLSLIGMCEQLSDKVVILSSPSRYNTSLCIEQKRKWLDANDCKDMAATFEKEKWKFAKDNCLLIDDYEKNIVKWRAAGGVAHHFKSIDEFRMFYKEMMEDHGGIV